MNKASMSIAESTSRRPMLSPAPRIRWTWTAPVVLLVGAAVSYPARESLYSAVVSWVASVGMGAAVEIGAAKGLLALVSLTAAVAVWCFFRARRQFWTLVCAGAGVITAYAISEGFKILVAEPRPCTGIDLATVLTCPGAGDWSWPSNHAVLAAAFATSCILAVSRTGRVATAAALVIAGSRVAAGVHYVHDVLSGLAMGVVVVAVAVAALRPLIDRFPATRETTPSSEGD